MSVHRLPLYRPPSRAGLGDPERDPERYPERPAALPGRAIAVLDPGDGAACLAFAARFAHEFRQVLLARGNARVDLGADLPVAIVSAEQAPAPMRAERAAFPPEQVLHAISTRADALAIAEIVRPPEHGIWLVVGQAALVFAPALVILVQADVPLLRWPDGLREARERVSLALSGDGLAVAGALARALAVRALG